MPFHSHHHSSSGQLPSTTSGLFASAQSLGAVGAPNPTRMSSGNTYPGSDPFTSSTAHAGGQTAPPASSGLSGPNSSSSTSTAGAQNYETPRRAQTIGRRPEELHMGDRGQGYTPQQYNNQGDYSAPSAPNIQLQQATPQGSSQYASPSSNNVPGALQPGGTSRPGPSAAYTAPTTIPTMPQINSNSQQYASTSRSGTLGASHSHSRSSPAGLDQKYVPFSSTPNATPAVGGKAYSPRTPTGAQSHSPLGLSDIRPRAPSDLHTEAAGPGAIFDYSGQPTNSSYLAPWASYAYDWCKWPVTGGNSCGKMAVGSYLEDPHNFVSTLHER